MNTLNRYSLPSRIPARRTPALAAFLLPALARADSLMEELALDPDGVNVGADWWKYILIALSGLLVVYLAIRLTLYILRLVGVLVCIAVGAAGAYFAQLLNPRLEAFMPESVQRFTPFVSGLIGFLVCYAVGTLIMMFIRKPAAPLRDSSRDK